jgi:hypothetical protein
MKLLGRAFLTILFLGIAYAVLIPSFVGCGAAWLTIHVRAIDANTRQPIPEGSVTLISQHRTETPEMRVSQPTVLSAQTDNDGRATVRDMFGAGCDNMGTSIYTGTSSIRCEAPGYSPAEVRITSSPRLRFVDFLFYKQPRTLEVSLHLARQ